MFMDHCRKMQPRPAEPSLSEKRPLKDSNAASHSSKRRKVPAKQKKCSSGPLDRFVVRSPLDTARTACRSPLGQQPKRSETQVSGCQLGPAPVPHLPVSSAGTGRPGTRRQLFETGAPHPTNEKATPSAKGSACFQHVTENGFIDIPPAIFGVALEEFVAYRALQDPAEEFDRLIHFGNVSTDNETTLAAEQLPTSIADICLTYMEPAMHPHLVTFLGSLVDARSYPQPQILSFVLWDVLMEGESRAASQDAYCLLHSVLSFHPPASRRMRHYYQQVLCYGDDRHNLDYFRGWEYVSKALDFVKLEETTKGGDAGCRRPTSAFRTNRILSLKYLVSLFETDFRFSTKRKPDDPQRVHRGETPLFAVLAWPNKRMDYVNVAVRGLIQTSVSLLCLGDDATDKPALDHCCLRLLAVAAECCRWADDRSTAGEPNDLLPEIGPMASSFAEHVCQAIADVQLDCQSLHSLLRKLKPSWLCMKVSQFLLEKTVAGDGGALDPNRRRRLSLSVLCSDYFRMVFGVEPNGELIANLSKRKLTVDVVPLTLQTPRSQKLSKDLYSFQGLFGGDSKITDGLGSACSLPNGNATGRFRNMTAATVNKRNYKGETSLHRACISNNVKRLRHLLSVPGVIVNAKDNAGWTPLHEACCHGSADCVRQLLSYRPRNDIRKYFSPGGSRDDQSVDVQAAGPDGVTPILDAVTGNHYEVARLLLRYKGATLLKAATENGKTAFDLAEDEQMHHLLEYYRHGDPVEMDAAPSRFASQSSSQCTVVSNCSGFSSSTVSVNTCRSMASTRLRSNFTLLYHSIVSYTTVHEPRRLWGTIQRLLQSRPADDRTFRLDKEAADAVGEDLAQHYKLKRWLNKVSKCFGEGDDDAVFGAMLRDLALLSISNMHRPDC